jgi:hypothetical protein
MVIPSLNWHTFMGTSGWDAAKSIAVDMSGNVYVAGYSPNWGTPVNPHAGGDDAFIAKLDPNGVLLWHTFLGSTSGDYGIALTLDVSGNVYLTGNSSTTWGTPINPHAGDGDAFIAKLDSSGVLQWNTFIGSADNDYGYAIDVDTSGNVYISGMCYATWGTPVDPHSGGRDAYVVKLDNNGVRQWHTFLGSSDQDYGWGIVTDTIGDVYVIGESQSTWGLPIDSHVGSVDAFVAKLNSNGIRQWNTFMGSTLPDYGYGITVDTSGNIYVTGQSYDWGAPVTPYSGGRDAFVAMVNSSGIRQWNTFLGSPDWDSGGAITVDSNGNVYITGHSKATWGVPFSPYTGDWDVFAAKLNGSVALEWNAFMGSSETDWGEAIIVDTDGSVYVAGYSEATWGIPINPHAGYYDAFVAKILQEDEEPEINVRFGGINFADGSTRNLGTRPSSFIMGREFTFTIENLGGAPLNLTGSPMVTLSGPQATHFYISQQPTSPVVAFDSTTFKLRTVRDSLPGFLPMGWTYPVSITVNIPNDDSDENPYDFTLNFTLQKDS